MQVTAEYVEQVCRANCIPVGYRYTIVMVSGVQRWLKEDIPIEYRLKFLEWLDRMANHDFGSTWLTGEMIAAVQPMCDRGFEMYNEASKLDRGKLGRPGFLDALANFFPTFAVLNPSLITALELGMRQKGYFLSVAESDASSGALLG